MPITVEIKKSDADRANKVFNLATVRVRKQIFNGLIMARDAAIQDMKDWFNEEHQTYSRGEDASRHIQFELSSIMLGDDAILTTNIVGRPQANSRGEILNIGAMLLNGTETSYYPIPRPTPSAGRMIFRFGKDARDAGKMFKGKDTSVVVNHPGYRYAAKPAETNSKFQEFMRKRVLMVKVDTASAALIKGAGSAHLAAQMDNPYYFGSDFD